MRPKRQIHIRPRRKAQLMVARILVAIHLAKRRAGNQTGIEGLGK